MLHHCIVLAPMFVACRRVRSALSNFNVMSYINLVAHEPWSDMAAKKLVLTLIFLNLPEESVSCAAQSCPKQPIVQKKCDTRQSIAASHIFHESMNLEADPCVDFYDFVCGNYAKDSSIPIQDGSINLFSKMNDVIYERIKTMLEDKQGDYKFISDKLVREFYLSCIDTDRIEERGLEPINKVLEDIGGWPLLEGSNWKPKKWMDIVFEIAEKTNGVPIDYLIEGECSI